MVAAALVLVGAGPLASAFVPFYGWDALTYHLAVPERYLGAQVVAAQAQVPTALMVETLGSRSLWRRRMDSDTKLCPAPVRGMVDACALAD